MFWPGGFAGAAGLGATADAMARWKSAAVVASTDCTERALMLIMGARSVGFAGAAGGTGGGAGWAGGGGSGFAKLTVRPKLGNGADLGAGSFGGADSADMAGVAGFSGLTDKRRARLAISAIRVA